MSAKTINAQQLSKWLEDGKEISILDIRPLSEREEWLIPNNIHINAYDELKSGKIEPLLNLSINKANPVIAFCGRGALSVFASEVLSNQGFEAYSLEGGMKAWNYAYDTASIEFENFKIIQIRRVAKGCLSYLIGSTGKAIVIDASLDPSIYISIAKTEGWDIIFVTDTHIHADYVSRSRDLTAHTEASHLMNDAAEILYPFVPLVNNDFITIGEIAIKIVHTPGHTWESTSFLIENKVLFSGDTLFTDGIGRPDLKADEAESIKKASALYDSLQLIKFYSDNLLIMPAHLSQPVEIGQPIIFEELGTLKKTLAALTYNRETFIGIILSNLPPSPPNYITISQINKSGYIGEFIVADLEAGANRCAIK